MVAAVSDSLPLVLQLAQNDSYQIMSVVENRWAQLSKHVQSVMPVEPIVVAHWKGQKVEAHAIGFIHHLT